MLETVKVGCVSVSSDARCVGVLVQVLAAKMMRALTSEMDYLHVCHHLVQDLASVAVLHYDC